MQMIVGSCSHVLLSIGQVSKVLVKFLVTLLVILVSQFILVAKIVSMVSGNFLLWAGIWASLFFSISGELAIDKCMLVATMVHYPSSLPSPTHTWSMWC